MILATSLSFFFSVHKSLCLSDRLTGLLLSQNFRASQGQLLVLPVLCLFECLAPLTIHHLTALPDCLGYCLYYGVSSTCSWSGTGESLYCTRLSSSSQ
ncbi:hypothetical protein BDF14DRAFT_1756445, partial [Spinellus fusiger]